MAIVKKVLVFLFFMVLSAALLSFFLPAVQKIERSITINAPIGEVYKNISSLRQFNSWSVWNQGDSSLRNTYSEKDGMVGAKATWAGDPEISGKGEMEIISLTENKESVLAFRFIEPNNINATSGITLEEKNGQTVVTWIFTVPTPRPWNISNLFFKLDKQMGKDFEQSLTNLKKLSEPLTPQKTGKAAFTVEQINFPATVYAGMRQTMAWGEIPQFLHSHFNHINGVLQNIQVTGNGYAGLFYEWDNKTQTTDLAAVVAIPADTKLEPQLSIKAFTIEASKAISVNFYGDHTKTEAAYESLEKFLKENKLTKKQPVIEQYFTDPDIVKDTAQWQTKIIFLVE
jgi:effector-binding domain-containing protein